MTLLRRIATRILLVAALLPTVAQASAPATPDPSATAAVSPCPANSGSRGWCGDGGPATLAHLNDPHQVAALASGGFLVADTGNNVIREVDANGVISTVAGTPLEPGDSGDGGRATEAKLDEPMGVAALGGGVFAIADTGNHRIRIVNADGMIANFGVNVSFSEPRSVIALADGSLLVADAGLSRIFKLSAAGVQTTVAGTEIAGFSGDGGRATEAQLNRPTSVAINQEGDILIADAGNRLVRRVAADANISTIGGGGGFPVAVGFAEDGSALIGDGADVLRLGIDGTFQRIAGSGRSGFDFDDGPALGVSLGAVSAVAAAGNGSILISDNADDRVRLLSPDAKISTVAGSGGSAPSGATGGPSVGFCCGAPAPAPPAPVRGNCRSRPAGEYQLSFPYVRAITARPGRVNIKVRSSANARLRLTIIRRGFRRVFRPRTVRTNSNTVKLGKLKAGTYTLFALASTPNPSGKPGRVYSCAGATLRVRAKR
jgi:hypothetical protein